MASGFDAVQYAGANARIKGLYAQLLSEETWHDLLAAKDLEGTITLLRDTDYGETVRAAEQRDRFTLERIERRFSGRSALNFRKAIAFTKGAVHKLGVVWWQHFELENLKAVFRAIDQGMGPETMRRFLIPLGDYSTLPWETLLHERSVSSLIERLRGTHYINPLRAAFPLYQRDRTLFAIEVALDIRYYRDIAAAIKGLNGTDRKDAIRILGTHLDILNILWAFRYRIYYGLSAEEIVNYTLWHTIRTDANLVRDIGLGAAASDILVRVWGENAFTPSTLESFGDESQMLPRLEFALLRYWRQRAENEMGGYPFKLGTILGYLVLQDLETRDLITLLEGKGMGWSMARIRRHLIRYKE